MRDYWVPTYVATACIAIAKLFANRLTFPENSVNGIIGLRKKKIVHKWFLFDLQYDIINTHTHTYAYINVYRIRKGKANKTTSNRRKSM